MSDTEIYRNNNPWCDPLQEMPANNRLVLIKRETHDMVHPYEYITAYLVGGEEDHGQWFNCRHDLLSESGELPLAWRELDYSITFGSPL